MGPTNRGERVNNQQAWVKKGGASATEKTGEGSDGEDEASRTQRREGGRGAGRGRNTRGRREPRDAKDGSSGAAVGAGATEDGTEGKTNNTRGGRGGRGQRGGRRGAAAENAASDEKENANSDEVGDSGLSGGALLHMLKANPPKVTRYTKGELLSIARLHASKIKPPDLSPLIDKENKDSQLLIRITGGRSVAAGDEDGIADVATARRERRERRSQRGERAEEEEGEEPRPRRSQRDAVAPVAPSATGPAAASSPSSPGAQQARVITPVAAGTASDKLLTAAKTFQEEDLDAIKSQSRGFEKWFDRKKLDQTPTAGASTSVASGGGGATPHSAGATGAGLRDSTGFAASYLQQQAQALGQAHAMQAAAYMQTMSLHAAAAAASRSGATASPTGGNYPPGSGNYPGWYNPYMFPYGGGHYSGYPSGLDYMSQAARNMTGGTGGGRGQQRLLGSGGAARGAASAKAVAAPKQAATPAASPGLRPSPLSGVASLPMAAKKTTPGPELTSAFQEAPLLTTQLAKDDDKGDDEDPESCTQS